MNCIGIQRRATATTQPTEIDAASELEKQEPRPLSDTDTSKPTKSLQPYVNEKKAVAQQEGQLRRMLLQGFIESKTVGEPIDPEIRERLSYSLSNLMITQSDVDSVHSRLQALSPRDYQNTMEGLHRSGLLKRYINHLEDGALKAFLAKAVDSRYIQRESAPVKTAEGKFSPPDIPQLLINDRRLPTEIREAIHAENLKNVRNYYQSYAEYMERYSKAALRAKSGEEIRAIGAPVERKNMAEPGVMNSRGDLDYSRFTTDWYSSLAGFPNQSRAYQAISDRMHDLTGAKRAGSAWFTSEFQLSAERKLGEDTTLAAQAKGRLEFSNYGARTTQSEVTGQASSEFAGIQFSDGAQKTVMSAPEAIRHESEIQRTTTNGVGIKQAGFSVQNDGTVEGSYAFAGAPHGFAKFNPNDGFMELGVGQSVESSFVKGQIRLGLGFQGSSPERARDAAIGDVGTFGIPPELERGINWKALAEDRRAYFQRSLGWTELEWNRRLATTELTKNR